MKIQVHAFYKKSQRGRRITGSLHVYLPELDIDVRGIKVNHEGKKWHFSMPMIFTKDESGNGVAFPVFQFKGVEKKKEFLEELRKTAQPWIEAALKGEEYQKKEIDQKASNLPCGEKSEALVV